MPNSYIFKCIYPERIGTFILYGKVIDVMTVHDASQQLTTTHENLLGGEVIQCRI